MVTGMLFSSFVVPNVLTKVKYSGGVMTDPTEVTAGFS